MSDSQYDQFSLFPSLPERGKHDPARQKDAKVQSAPAIAAEPKKSATKRKSGAARGKTQPPETEPESPLISDQTVANRYGVSRPTIWRWTNTLEGFPQPIKVSGGTTRWKLTDLQAFDRSRLEKPSQPRRKIGKTGAP